jgi:integral membrane protein (TIGR00529 family)
MAGEHSTTADSMRKLALSVWPIVLVLVLAIVLQLDLIISLLVATTMLLLVSRTTLGGLWRIVRHHIRWDTVLVIFGAMIFRRVLEETGAIAAASHALTQARVPPVAAIFIIPFVAGLLSGLATAAFAIGFPIILPLSSGGAIDPAMAVWAWAGGFLGVMMSPMHLCLSLTRLYFHADWGPIYRRLIPAALLVLGTAGALIFLL